MRRFILLLAFALTWEVAGACTSFLVGKECIG